MQAFAYFYYAHSYYILLYDKYIINFTIISSYISIHF